MTASGAAKTAVRTVRFPLRAKLAVGAVDDPLETEADRVADRVMRMPEPTPTADVHPMHAAADVAQRVCEKCEDEAKLQRKAEGASSPGSMMAPQGHADLPPSSGQPLDGRTRAFMEPRFGDDFGLVRVHTDAWAAASARAMNALAYTVGHDIVFGAGSFAPGTAAGRRLLAHELAHVRQQAPAGTVQRQPAATAPLQDVTVKRGSAPVDRVTVPHAPGLSLTAHKRPAHARNVVFSLDRGTATIAPGTAIDPVTGAIAIAPAQTGGSVNVVGTQTLTATGPHGTTTTHTRTAPLRFVAIPAGLAAGTTASLGAAPGLYGGRFTHTFNPPSGSGPDVIRFARVNERFPGGSGTTLTLTSALGSLNVTINDPTSPNAGWSLDASGTTHDRTLDDRGGHLVAVTTANNVPLVEDYAGPAVFRRCRATPASLPISQPMAPSTTLVQVDREGAAVAPHFSIQGPTLGCTIGSSTGILTAGTTPGTVTVRAGTASNFDATTVTITRATP